MTDRGSGMVQKTIDRYKDKFEELFERMLDTPVTAAEWNRILTGRNARGSSKPFAIDSFDEWLAVAQPGYLTYMICIHEMLDIEQDAFDAYHHDDFIMVGNRTMCIGLLGAYYNEGI